MTHVDCALKTDRFAHGGPFPHALSPGEWITVDVADCFGGFPGREADVWHGDPNPITGPFFVRDTKPGDTLAVDIGGITPVGDGFVGTPHQRIAIPLDRRRRCACFPGGHEIPLRPHIGTIGVAPAEGAVPTTAAGPHGGNLDCNPIRSGCVICFRVRVPGAGLGFGDVHAVMGDGETGGQGVEVAATVSLRARLVEGPEITTPYGLCDRRFFTIGVGTEPDEAADMAVGAMVVALTELTGQGAPITRKYLGAAGNLRICWRGGTLAVMRMELPLAHLNPDAARRIEARIGRP